MSDFRFFTEISLELFDLGVAIFDSFFLTQLMKFYNDAYGKISTRYAPLLASR